MVYILIELSFHLILRLTSILTGNRSPNRVSRLQGRGSVSTPCIRVSDRSVHTTCQAPSAFENIRSEDLEVLHMTKVKERKIHRIICVLFPNCIGFPKNIFVCVAGPVWPDKILAAQSSHMRAHTHMHTHMHTHTPTCMCAHTRVHMHTPHVAGTLNGNFNKVFNVLPCCFFWIHFPPLMLVSIYKIQCGPF